AEYVAAASGYAQVLWIQNQLLDYGWLVQKKTALGKDTSNPLIVDSLLKTIWFSIHHHLTIEVLAIPGQTATGVNTPKSDEDRLKLMKLMVLLLQNDVCDEIGNSVARLSSYCCQANNKVGDLSTHTTCFISPALTQKVFANMRRVWKGFLGVETPLFKGMLAVGQPAEEGLVAEQVQVDDAAAAAVEENCVKNLENDNAAQKLVIVKLKARVKKLEKANKSKSSKLRRLRKVGASRRVESSDDIEDVFNQGRMIADMDMNEGIELVKDAKVAKSEGRHAEKQAEIYNLDLDHSSKVLSMEEDDSEVQEVVKVVTNAKLITKVFTAAASQEVSAASTTIPAASTTIPAASATIPAAKPTILAAILTKKDQIEMDAEYAKKLQEEINNDYEKFS
nr:hypothetical protein [Tanacetum cinerariifolium]